MKKITALVLAVVLAMSMATVSFAAPVASNQEPGADIKFAAADFGVKDSAYFSTEYFRIDTLKYKTGATLVESAKLDDGEFVITLKKNYALELKTVTNFEIEKIAVKTIKSFTNTLDGTVDKYKVFTLTGQTMAFSVGYAVNTPADTTITDNGFYKFAMTESYKDYTFSKSDASVDFRAYDDEKMYLGLNNDINKDLVKANPEAELTFYNFEGATAVNNGKIFLSVDKESFVYEMKDGKLVKSALKWSDSDYAFTGKVSTLGSYVVSDKELKDAAPATTEGAKNPNTGANDVVGVAVALAVVSLVAAGAFSLKK